MPKGVGGDVESAEQQLSLHVLIDVVKPGHIGSSITNHQVSEIALKVLDDLLCGRFGSDVTDDGEDTRDRSDLLQVYSNDLCFSDEVCSLRRSEWLGC